MKEVDTHEKKGLLYKLQLGNVTAIAAVYNLHKREIFDRSGFRSQNHTGAGEIMQDISLSLSTQRKDLNIAAFLPPSLSAFINVVNNLFAKRNRQQFFSLYTSCRNGFVLDNLITKRVRSKRPYELLNGTIKLIPKRKIFSLLSREQQYTSQKQNSNQPIKLYDIKIKNTLIQKSRL